MSPRKAIVRVLAEHDWREGDAQGRTSRHVDHHFDAWCAVCSGDIADMAAALVTSGALPDATQIRAQAYRDAASIVETFEDGPAAAKALAWMADREADRPKWVDLFGAAPNYAGGKPVDQWLDEQRGEA